MPRVTMPLLTAICCTTMLVPTAPALGDEVNPRWIPADVEFVAHLDLEAFKSSTIGRYMIEHQDDLALPRPIGHRLRARG